MPRNRPRDLLGLIATPPRQRIVDILNPTGRFNPMTDCVSGSLRISGRKFSRVHPFWGDWSPDFLHSSDVVLACSPVWGDVVPDGDAITRIDRLRFLSIMQGQLDVAVGTLDDHVSLDALFLADRGKPAFVCEAQTRNQLRVGLVAYSVADKVATNRKWSNPFIHEVDKDFHGTTYDIESQTKAVFSIPLLPRAFQFTTGREQFSTVTSMDIVMHMRQRLEYQGCVPYLGSPLAAGFRGFEPPKLEFFATPDPCLVMTFDFNNLRSTGSYFKLSIPFEFCNKSSGNRAGGGIYDLAIRRSAW